MTVLLAVGGASLSVMPLHCRWSSDVMRVSKPVGYEMASAAPALQLALHLHYSAPLLAVQWPPLDLLCCLPACRCPTHTWTSPLVAIEAVSIMAGFGKQFTSQHYLWAARPWTCRRSLWRRCCRGPQHCCSGSAAATSRRSLGQGWTTARCTLWRPPSG